MTTLSSPLPSRPLSSLLRLLLRLLRSEVPAAGRDGVEPPGLSPSEEAWLPPFAGVPDPPPPIAGSRNCRSGHLSRQWSIRMSPGSNFTSASFDEGCFSRRSSPPRLTAMSAALYRSLNPTSTGVRPMSEELLRTLQRRIWWRSSSALRTATGVSFAANTSWMGIGELDARCTSPVAVSKNSSSSPFPFPPPFPFLPPSREILRRADASMLLALKDLRRRRTFWL